MDQQVCGEEIAIVGSGCRFPGRATSPHKLWEILREPHILAEPIPEDRFSGDGFYHPNGQYHGHFNVKEGYFLADEGVHRRFDAFFFGMNPAEAVCLDPQCRLLLEVVYEALETAGVSIKALQGSDTAMYAGQMVADYDQILMRDSDHSLGIYHASGTSHAILSNRISYFFDWHGPSMTIDTACSSSLVAVHHAVQQLRTGQSRVAVAAGSNLILDPKCFISLASLSLLSPDGRCRMWDADAKGYARGEGVAAIILKTVKAALEDGDDIECIIRETAFGQDGRTQGITSPNPAAQTSLIRQAYSRAGLDLSKPANRPQFFECHGTGTLAGDAAEAEAIETAIFSTKNGGDFTSDFSGVSQKLWVGSIKTIVGHTEGTAGIAGILKASLALKNATVPPNLLFDRLNPRIEPFYRNVGVSTKSIPWPSCADGQPRRASVNSFGFGGANVHAILESYEPETERKQNNARGTVFTPFVFSAASEASLRTSIGQYQEYLTDNRANICLRDLAYTLHSRRSVFQFTTSITASKIDDLVSRIGDVLQENNKHPKQYSIRRVHRHKDAGTSNRLNILGIFTGQGAQWAGMASALIQNSQTVRETLSRLDTRLSELPLEDRPDWSLSEELLKAASSSRINEASVSQPLCTAIQILQVNILRAAGIRLAAVVGHSSGEIGAAYASGFLTAEDAICIAYYRGLHSHLARHKNMAGSMIAVGTSVEDAQDLCNEPEFYGRVVVAAINSPVSVTLSGDQDAIEEMRIVLGDEKKFARILNVDKAYHSHHMYPCSEAYMASLASLKKEIGVRVEQDDSITTWFSTVFNGEDMNSRRATLENRYWNDNMISPVQFQRAIRAAQESMGEFALAVELGPHPALQGPTLQTLQDLLMDSLPYTSLFRRGISAVESIADCFGYIWSSFGGDAVDMRSYDEFISGQRMTNQVVKGLPTYSWDHGEFWNESRYAEAIRCRPGPLHELLGHMTPDSTEQDLRWRHVLKPSEVPWLVGHKLQDQIVFPAAGYLSTALEAALAVCKYQNVSASLIELLDIEFGRALIFDDSTSSAEIIVSMAGIKRIVPDTIEAHFRYHASQGQGNVALNLISHGMVRISIGEPFDEVLPARNPDPPNLIKVPAEDFYSASRDLEYQWAGPFMGLDKLERKLGYATGCINVSEPTGLLVHPTIIDIAFQGILLGYSYPDDGQLWSIHVPARVKRLSINPALCKLHAKKGPLPFVATHHPDVLTMTGNTEVYAADPRVENAIIQIEDMDCIPLSRATIQDDQEVFATIQWGPAEPDTEILALDSEAETLRKENLNRYLEHWTAYYLREIEKAVPINHESRKKEPLAHLLRHTSNMTVRSREDDRNPLASHPPKIDTIEQIISSAGDLNGTIEMQLLHSIAASLLDPVRLPTVDNVPIDGNMLRKFYTDAFVLRSCRDQLIHVMKQLVHRTPNAKVIQIGAETGATTQAVFDTMASSLASYTVTDVCSEQFEHIKTLVPDHLNKIRFSTLDICRESKSQGFTGQSFDIAVVFLALRSGPDLLKSLQNILWLLKPGGRMIVIEVLPTISLAYRMILGALPHWWKIVSENQYTHSILELAEWDSLLRQAGFSGCEATTAISPDKNGTGDLTLFFTQAMDERTSFLKNPLANVSLDLFRPQSLIEDLVILGGKSLRTVRLISDLKHLVKWQCGKIREARSLQQLGDVEISPNTTVLSLAQLDTPIFHNLDESDWNSLKRMLMTARVLLWVTQGRRAQNPYAAMMVGLLRSIVREVPTLNYRILDFEGTVEMNAHSIANSLLQFQAELKFLNDGDLHTSMENEIVIERGGRALIPRLVMNSGMNQRYNSHRQAIYSFAHPWTENICMVSDPMNASYQLVEGPIFSSRSTEVNKIRLEVKLSFMSAIRVDISRYLFPIWGRDTSSGDLRFGLSHTHSSIANVSENSSIVVKVALEGEREMFSLIVLNMLASSILRDLNTGDCILLYEPEDTILAVVCEEASNRGIECTVVTTSDSSTEPVVQGCHQVAIHPSTPTSALIRVLPKKLSLFVNFQVQKKSKSTVEKIESLLPFYCRRETPNTLFAAESSQSSSPDHETNRKLNEVVERASRMINRPHKKSRVLPLVHANALSAGTSEFPPFAIVKWGGSEQVSVRIRPITTRIMFSGHKTYWLAGLSRGLGLALCEWMIRHGARHFVISSRNPQIASAWLREARHAGAVIKVTSCDIAVKEQVDALHRQICETMPAIAGVCQGSMVLVDTAIRDMTRENFLDGTRPKVEGSIHLNSLFQENTLEFFVFFSSVVSTIGRPGQVNYSASNMFMASLAEQRRQKGLAASVIHIGPIYGVGYAAQSDKVIYSRAAFRSTGLVPTSERDFYQIFTEAVIAGQPAGPDQPEHNSCQGSIEILNGLRTVSTHESDRPVWESEPLMSHFIKDAGHTDQEVPTGHSKVPVKSQLLAATDRDQVYNIIQDALLPKLYILFQIDPSTITKEAMTAMRLVEIGIDSLLAVEIRGWFMKTLEVNIPVLKILSGVPIHDLIQMASQTILERQMPGLAGSGTEDIKHDDLSELDDQFRSSRRDETRTEVKKTPGNSVPVFPNRESGHARTSLAKIASRTINKTIRLSFSQEMFWFVWIFLNDKASLNHTAWAHISGSLHIPDLERAFQAVGQQHEILRTCIVEENGTPMQVIMNTSSLKLEVKSIQLDDEVHGWTSFLQDQHVYDVAHGHTARVILLSKSSTDHFLVAGLHPLIADGISFQSLLKVVQQLYLASTESQGLAVSHLRQYSDYSERQHEDLSTGAMDADLKYWKEEFTQQPPPLPILTLSSLTTRPDLVEYKNIRARFDVSLQTKALLHHACRRNRITPFQFYVATFRALLLRYSATGEGEDIIVGIGDANRLEDEMVDVIGPFVNLLPLRLQAKDSTRFTDLLQHTREKIHAAMGHSKLPFRVLLNELGVSRSSTYTSLFQCFVNYRQGMRKLTTWESASGKKADVHAFNIGLPKVAYDVTLEMVDYIDGECTQEIVMRQDMYSQAEVNRLAESYRVLINSFLEDPTSLISSPDIFPKEEIAEVISFTRGPSRSSQWPETVAHRIEHVAHAEPERTAIWLGNTPTSYAKLNNDTHAIASALHDASVAIGSTVGVMMEPNAAFIASLLGVLHVGAVYLPLELSWPWARLSTIAADCNVSVVLVDETSVHLVGNLRQPGLRVINTSTLDKVTSPLPILAKGMSPAALLYTSGSSGVPKGIYVKHEGIRNWIENATKLYDISGYVAVLQQTTPTFDISLIQIFTALCLGGSLCLVPREHRGDAHVISQVMRSRHVTLTCATPSEYLSWFQFADPKLLKTLSAWRTAFSLGESVPVTLMGHVRTAKLSRLSFYNLYGPTEASLAATGGLIPNMLEQGPISAGIPLPNYSVYVLDRQMRLIPAGMQGEIYIGGAGVSLGYHNRPMDTKRMFVPNTFATAEDKRLNWNTMHRTGDLGRWRSDDTLLIEGRIDTQVKVRGLRIDLSEVENIVIEVSDGAVREVAVTPRELSSDKSTILIAHAVFASEANVELTKSTIRSRLREKLPQYMCPGIIVALDHIPRTSAAKLDRRYLTALPLDQEMANMPGFQTEKDVQAALTPTEAKLRDIWAEILGLQFSVVPATDFFHVGGSSMLLLELQKNILDVFSISMPLVAMFRGSTLRSMAEWLDCGSRKSFDNPEIDWEEEVALPTTFLELDFDVKLTRSSSRIVAPGLTIILTGVTGKLGREMLQDLLGDDRVRHVHCIAVRNVHKRQGSIMMGLWENATKVTFHDGDLVLPRLGLSKEEASTIFATADIIIHSGSDMSYLKTYGTLRAVNLQSTKTLAEMCARYSPGKYIRFHYVSTISVGHVATWTSSKLSSGGGGDFSVDQFVLHPVSVSEHVPTALVADSDISHTAHGYIATKWASEVFLEHLHQRHPHWPIFIHRPSLIAKTEDEDSDSTLSSLEFVENVRQYATLLKAVPALPMRNAGGGLSISGSFNVVPLHAVVEGMRGSIFGQDIGGLQFLHHLGNVEIQMSDVKSWLSDSIDKTHIEEIEVGEWTRMAVKLGMHPTIESLLKNMQSSQGHLVIPESRLQ